MLAWNGTPGKAVGTLSWRLQGQQESTCQLSQTAETILGKGAGGECLVSLTTYQALCKHLIVSRLIFK